MLRVPHPRRYPPTPLTVSPAVRDTLEHHPPFVCQTSPCRSQRKVTARNASPLTRRRSQERCVPTAPDPSLPPAPRRPPATPKAPRSRSLPPAGRRARSPPPDASAARTREARPAAPRVPRPRASSLPRHRRLGRERSPTAAAGWHWHPRPSGAERSGEQ